MKDLSVIIAAIIAFAVTLFSGYFVIPYLRKLKFGQTILEEGPNWHKSKQGTPTMGGIMMILGFIAAIIITFIISLFANNSLQNDLRLPIRSTHFIAGIGLALCMAAIGFVDDFIKVVKKRNLGLTSRQKTFAQLLVAVAYLLCLSLAGMKTTNIPFIGDIDITRGFGLLFWPIAVCFIYGFTNAVNLTDGIDGLASSVTMVVACTFMLASGSLGLVSNNVLSAALAGACVGFICWNSHPAKVFMGDTGSMFLGGLVVALAFGCGRPIILIFSGIIYLLEALSDIIQVAYYKKTKKRIFKMAPLHHHFEMCGWNEDKIVLIFSLVTLVGSMIALLPIIFNK